MCLLGRVVDAKRGGNFELCFGLGTLGADTGSGGLASLRRVVTRCVLDVCVMGTLGSCSGGVAGKTGAESGGVPVGACGGGGGESAR